LRCVCCDTCMHYCGSENTDFGTVERYTCSICGNLLKIEVSFFGDPEISINSSIDLK